MSDIESRVKNSISQHLNVPVGQIQNDNKLIDDLSADSLDFVELVMEWEGMFGVEILDDEAADIDTVGDAVKLIKRKTGEKNE